MPTLPVCLCRNKFDRKGRRRVLLGPRAFLWVAAIGADALLIVADLLSLTISPKGPSVESLTSGAYAVQSVLKLAAAALLLFGLLGLHLRQAGAAGNLGIAGFLAAFFGTTLVVGAFWAMPSLRRRWPPALPNGSGLAKEAPAGTASGGFRVFVGGLHSRMGTVWGSGDEGPGLPPCGHHTAHIWCGSRVRLAARRRVPHQHLVQRGYSLAGLCTLDRRGRISRTTLPGEVVSEREALGLSVNRGTLPPNFMHTLLAGGYNVGR